MPLTETQLCDALKIATSSKDKIVKAHVPADGSTGAAEYVVESCHNGVLTLAKAPASHT